MSQFPSPYGGYPPPYQGNPSYPEPYGQQTSFPSPKPPSGYAPVQFDDPHTGKNSAQFYGQLIDPFGRPSEIFARLCDAIFFYIDQNCPRNRGTGVLEPDKLYWESATTDPTEDPAMIQVLYRDIASLYDTLAVPYTFDPSRTAVLDRRGFLHLGVIDARATPDETHKVWNRRLNTFKLIDPLTNLPFPTPLPRESFPLVKDAALNNTYVSWATQGVIKYQQQKTQAQYSQMFDTFSQTNAVQTQMQTQMALAQIQAMQNSYSQPQAFSLNSLAGMGGGAGSGTGSGGGEQSGKSALLNLAANVASNLLSGDDGSGGGGGSDFGFGN